VRGENALRARPLRLANALARPFVNVAAPEPISLPPTIARDYR
jgi:hypothetical protein